jgi:hypothetical protein
MTDEALMNETIEAMERLNIVGVLSGEQPERIAAWMAAAPGRFIPGLVLRFGPAGADFPTDSLRSLHAAGRLAVLGEVINQYAGIAPDDERMEAYWALAEELDIPVGIHVGPGPPGAIYLGSAGYRARPERNAEAGTSSTTMPLASSGSAKRRLLDTMTGERRPPSSRGALAERGAEAVTSLHAADLNASASGSSQ